MTEEERQRVRDDFLAMIAGGRTDLPETELVRWTVGHADYSQQLAACLREAGFSAVSDDAGGVSYNPGVPASQEEARTLAFYVCNARYTLDPNFMGDWTEDQIGLVYDYWDQYFIPCMDAHGASISRESMPSRAVHIATFFDAETERWWPSAELYHLSPADQERLAPICPPMPPSEAMYGN